MKWLLRLGLVVVLLAVLAIGALGWLVNTEAGLRAAVGAAQRGLGGRLVITEPQGSLDGTMRIASAVYTADGTTIEVSGIEVATHLAAVLERRLVLERIDVARVVVHQQPAKESTAQARPALPQSLELPVDIRVDNARIRLIEVVGAATTTRVRNLHVSYTGGRTRHTLRSLRAETDLGFVGAAGSMGAASPYGLDVGLAFLRPGATNARDAAPANPADLPLEMSAHLGGSLRETAATTQARVARAEASAQAVLTLFDRPWPESLRTLELDASGVDLAHFMAGLPRTTLSLHAAARGTKDTLAGDLTVRNAAPGPIDRQRVPVSSLSTRFVTDLATLRLDQIALDLAPRGALRGTGSLQREPLAAQLDIKAENIDLRAIRSDLQATALAGPLLLSVEGPQKQSVSATLAQADIRVSARAQRDGDNVDITEVQLAARGGTATGRGQVRLATPTQFNATVTFSRFDPARFGAFVSGAINGNARAEGELGTPRRVDAQWQVTPSQLRGQPLTSQGRLRLVGERIEKLEGNARLGANSALVAGAFGGPNDRLRWQLDAPVLAQLADGIGGKVNASGTLSGAGPRMQAEVLATGSALRLPANTTISALRLQGRAGLQPDAPLEIALKAQRVATPQIVIDTASVDSTGTRAHHEATLRANAAQRSLALQLRGGWSGQWPGEWAGELATAQVRTDAPVRANVALAAPAPITLSADRVAVGALNLVVSGDAAPNATFRLADLTWQPGRLTTSGAFDHLSTRWLAAVVALPPGVETTVSFAGQWSIRAEPRLNGTLSVVREDGDLRLAGPPAIEAGLSDVSLRARFDEGNVAADLAVNGKLATLRADAKIEAARDAEGLGVTPASPLAFKARLDVGELRLITEPLQTFARVSGRLAANLQGGGTLAAPRAEGTLNGDGLAIDVPPYGVQLTEGVLRAELHGEQLRLTQLALRGGDGRFTADGTLVLKAGAPADLKWRAENFRLLNRPDMRLVVTGNGNAGVADGRFGLRGELRAERGHFELAQRQLPQAGKDVAILGEEPPPEAGPARAPLSLDLRVDLGKALTVRGAGFDGKATGSVHLTTTREGELRAAGRVQAADAKFRAYGQQLVVDPGVLVFDGPIDNPTLQITAWRRNQQVEAGVQLSGTAKAPQVTLVSEPAVPQGDRLSWLVLGRGPGSATGADLALLQAAAGALLGGGDSVPLTQKVANSLGLDELAVRSSSEIATSVVAVGKRLSDKLLVTYEHGLGTAAENLVKLDYALTRRVSLRAETGSTTGLGVFYRLAWD